MWSWDEERPTGLWCVKSHNACHIARSHVAYRVAATSTFHLAESRHICLEDVHLLHQGGESGLCGLTHLLINSFGLGEKSHTSKHAQVFLGFSKYFIAGKVTHTHSPLLKVNDPLQNDRRLTPKQICRSFTSANTKSYMQSIFKCAPRPAEMRSRWDDTAMAYHT